MIYVIVLIVVIVLLVIYYFATKNKTKVNKEVASGSADQFEAKTVIGGGPAVDDTPSTSEPVSDSMGTPPAGDSMDGTNPTASKPPEVDATADIPSAPLSFTPPPSVTPEDSTGLGDKPTAPSSPPNGPAGELTSDIPSPLGSSGGSSPWSTPSPSEPSVPSTGSTPTEPGKGPSEEEKPPTVG